MIRSIKLHDLVIFGDDDNLTDLKILQNGLNYEPHIRAELERLIPTATGFLDLGANIGLHTLSAKQIRRDLPCVAVEASRANVAKLLRSITTNNLTNITVIPVPVSATPSIIQTNLDYSNTTCSTLGTWTAEEQWELSAALPLDFYHLPPISLIKMDIEGFEGLALQGATRLFQARPTVIFEFCPEVVHRSHITPAQLLQWFLDRGYQLTCLDYIPGIRKTFRETQPCLDYIAATTKWITDILAEPIDTPRAPMLP